LGYEHDIRCATWKVWIPMNHSIMVEYLSKRGFNG
jgi:hypothetical protein